MEQNLFTEGVRPGSVTTPEEVHMLICYIFREAGQPVSFFSKWRSFIFRCFSEVLFLFGCLFRPFGCCQYV